MHKASIWLNAVHQASPYTVRQSVVGLRMYIEKFGIFKMCPSHFNCVGINGRAIYTLVSYVRVLLEPNKDCGILLLLTGTHGFTY